MSALSLLRERDIELLSIDLDDTLIDTEAGAVARFEAAAEMIAHIRPDIASATVESAIKSALSTHPTEGRMKNFFVDLGVEEPAHVDEIRNAYFGAMALQNAPPFADVLEALDGLRKHFRLALLTNGPSTLQRGKLRRHALEPYFEWIVISEEAGSEKPDRAIFDHLLAVAGLAPERAAHCGDSLAADVAGANSAGWMSIWVKSALVRTSPTGAGSLPHLTVAHLRDLLG